ncbi:hypothetical protein WOLCODRAFT_112414 [Wolfiporia cocos MD-104 SS10]|uniref:Uncharacterized protein n=1 Tax=Wolfiporia cocos (strain MD-104) TaxID=742152 RepID=A0A2H3IUS5_WOLCO|nr:hypothetical protein WOLCODRAFT_112414 [Wolfiporia cocos MD-104 SS10]
MPRRNSNGSNYETKGKSHKAKSASEIARNVEHFHTWSERQRCEQVSISDIPAELQADIQAVFDFKAQLPAEWCKKTSKASRSISFVLPDEFLKFLREIPSGSKLFSKDVLGKDCKQMLSDLQLVFAAWTRLKKMRESSRKWSEADYVANVYNVFRSSAIHESDYQVERTICLPQPLCTTHLKAKELLVLNVQIATPDSSIYIPARYIKDLSHGASSPYMKLKERLQTRARGHGGAESLRYQSTPSQKISTEPGFEFVSAFWEDKKPLQSLLDSAYRQNRMATTSAVRQLHALHINAPIFGLVWSQGKVRAHVDWWIVKPNSDDPTIQSAFYIEPTAGGRRDSTVYHEWDLEDPEDILQVYLLIRNLDRWTTGRFCELVYDGINQLVVDVSEHGQKIVPWRRTGDLRSALHTVPENSPPPNSAATPPASPQRPRTRQATRRPLRRPSDTH